MPPVILDLDAVPQWIISDTHFGHANILVYCPWRRTWAGDIATHDRILHTAWRSTIAATDRVLHLGDLVFPSRAAQDLAPSLPGQVVILKGNHDHRSSLQAGGWRVADIITFCAPHGQRIVAMHDPQHLPASLASRCDLLLHGHCHGNTHRDSAPWPAHVQRLHRMDCSLDALQTRGPVNLAQLLAKGPGHQLPALPPEPS